VREEYTDDFIVAEAILQEGMVKDPELCQQLEQKEVPSDCINFIEHLLTVDPEKRPTVDEALSHPYLQS
jgi:serine/threonine protein kinase